MSNSGGQPDLSPTHHAMLFAWLCRAVIQQAGEDRGEEVMRRAVRCYGEERGQRMALRARTNRHALSMANYLAYGEWQAGKGEMRQRIVARIPDAIVHVVECPWCRAWQVNHAIRFGRLYCLEVDEAVLRGFNPHLRLYLNWCLTLGDGQCEFVFRDANLTLPTLLSLAYKRAIKPGKAALLPWEVHIGHLYSTVDRIVVEELGQRGQEAVRAGLDEFASYYGEDATHKIRAYQEASYNWSSLPVTAL